MRVEVLYRQLPSLGNLRNRKKYSIIPKIVEIVFLWQSAISHQRSENFGNCLKPDNPSIPLIRGQDFRICESGERAMNCPIRWVVSSLDGSNLRLLGFSLFRSRRFQQQGRGGPDRILRQGWR